MANFILPEKQGPVLTVTLNRPELGNPFDPSVIHAFQNILNTIDFDESRVLVLKGAGKYFCSGAHLQWMRAGIEQSKDLNQKEAMDLAQLLHTLFALPIPTIALVQGNAYAGGVGLVAACDFAIAHEAVQFCISETRLGLIPALISPYLQHVLGAQTATRLALMAAPFSAREALQWGLISHLVPEDKLNETLHSLTSTLLKNGPLALKMTKSLFKKEIELGTLHDTSALITQIRMDVEAQEGMRAFFEKRPPAWTIHKNDV